MSTFIDSMEVFKKFDFSIKHLQSKNKSDSFFDYIAINKKRRKLHYVIVVERFSTIEPILSRLKHQAKQKNAKVAVFCSDIQTEKTILTARAQGIGVIDKSALMKLLDKVEVSS